MDEGRKRVIGIMAAILVSLHMRTADDLFWRDGKEFKRKQEQGPVDHEVD